MAIPGPGLSLFPVDGATRTAIAQRLACWGKMDNGMTDPRIQFYTCGKLGYYYIPPEVCSAGYGPIPFTSRGDTLTCDAEEDNQHDRTVLPSDVLPIDPNTCSTDAIRLATPMMGDAEAGNAEVDLSWEGVPGASSYEVRYKTMAATTWSDGPDVNAPATTATVASLTNGTTYVFQVRAKHADYQDSRWSVSVSATPAA